MDRRRLLKSLGAMGLGAVAIPLIPKIEPVEHEKEEKLFDSLENISNTLESIIERSMENISLKAVAFGIDGEKYEVGF